MRLHMRCHPRQQLLLDLQVFRHRLNDPIALGELRQIIVEVAGANARGSRRRVERGRLALLQRVERLVRNGVAGAVAAGQIQQQHAHAGICQMRGNPRAHGARAQHCGLPQQQRRLGCGCGAVSLGNSFHALLFESSLSTRVT